MHLPIETLRPDTRQVLVTALGTSAEPKPPAPPALDIASGPLTARDDLDDVDLRSPRSEAPMEIGKEVPHDRLRAHRRRVCLRVLGTLLTGAVFLGAVAVCIWQLVSQRSFTGAVITAGVCAGCAVLISALEIFQHLVHFSRPALQRQTVRILLMVTVYSTCSFFSLLFPFVGPILDVVRELYEALTIYAFTWFLLIWLELDANLCFASFAELLASHAPVQHIWPMNHLLKPWPMGTPYIRAVQTGVLNYVVLRPITAIFGFALAPSGLYTSGELSPRNAYVWLASINSFSQAWAIYSLLMLYRACKADLAGIKVVSKMICVKGIVFFTFWQSMLIAVGIRLRVVQAVVTRHGSDSDAELETRLQNFLLCVEMLLFALAHSYAFSAREYWGGAGAAPPSAWAAAAVFLDWRDLGVNMAGQVSQGASGIVDGMTFAGRAMLDGAAWPGRAARRALAEQRARREAEGTQALLDQQH